MAGNSITVKDIFFHRHVLIEITKRCNLRCRHCFTDAGIKSDHELDPEQWIDVAKDLCSNNFNAFTISGGEPLLEFDKTIVLAKKIRSLDLKAKIYLFTNGLLITKKHIPIIKKIFNGVGTSIDGIEQTHEWIRNKRQSYKMAIHTIDLLRQNDMPIFIQSMVTPQTQPHLEDVVKLAVKKNIGAIRFSHVDFFGRAIVSKHLLGSPPENLERLTTQVKALTKKYKVYVTTNLVRKQDLKSNSKKFRIPSLHVLPNGSVLPLYGLPNKYYLWKYPKETLNSILPNKLSRRMNSFYNLLEKARSKAINTQQSVIDHDNVIAVFL